MNFKARCCTLTYSTLVLVKTKLHPTGLISINKINFVPINTYGKQEVRQEIAKNLTPRLMQKALLFKVLFYGKLYTKMRK